MHWDRFLAFNALGAALWVGVWTAIGYLSGRHITEIYNAATRSLRLPRDRGGRAARLVHHPPTVEPTPQTIGREQLTTWADFSENRMRCGSRARPGTPLGLCRSRLG